MADDIDHLHDLLPCVAFNLLSEQHSRCEVHLKGRNDVDGGVKSLDDSTASWALSVIVVTNLHDPIIGLGVKSKER